VALTGQPAQTLRDLIDQALEKQGTTSINQLAKIGQKANYTITQTTLSQIHNGTYRSQPKAPTLDAISYLSGASIEDTYRAANLGAPGVPFKPAPGADKLTPKQRDVVNGVIRALLEAGDSRTQSDDPGIEWSSDTENVESSSGDRVAYIAKRNQDHSNELTQSE
jgi:hypothetical protein